MFSAELAGHIRVGLSKRQTIVEDPNIWGVVEGPYGYMADVIGFALIGKLGLPRAVKAVKQAMQESDLKGDSSEPAVKVYDEIGLTLEEGSYLGKLNRHVSAAAMASMMEKGDLVYEPT